METEIKIIGVKTDKGIYISQPDINYPILILSRLLFDGEKPIATFHDKWLLIKKEPEVVEQLINQPNINHRYELKEDLPFTDGLALPSVMPKDEVMELNEDGKYCTWKDEFKHLQTFYDAKSDPVPPKKEPVEFNYSTILEIPEIKIEPDFKYLVQMTEWERDGIFDLKTNSIIYQVIDKIVFPSVVLPNTPSALSSHDTYRIIRQHVKQNIDLRYAEITSDYNFCFEVAKIVPLANNIAIKREIKNARGRSYRKPKYSHALVKSRQIRKVFEMTYAPENCRGYTPIPSFIGKNHQDLKVKIDDFLNNLMARINEPLIECKQCGGMGVIVEDN